MTEKLPRVWCSNCQTPAPTNVRRARKWRMIFHRIEELDTGKVYFNDYWWWCKKCCEEDEK